MFDVSYEQYLKKFDIPSDITGRIDWESKLTPKARKQYGDYTVYLVNSNATFNTLDEFLDLFGIPSDYNYGLDFEMGHMNDALIQACDNFMEQNNIPACLKVPILTLDNHTPIYPNMPKECRLCYLKGKLYYKDYEFIHTLVHLFTPTEKHFYDMIWVEPKTCYHNSSVYHNSNCVIEPDYKNVIDCSGWSKQELLQLAYIFPTSRSSEIAMTPFLFLDILDRFYDGKVPENFDLGWYYNVLSYIEIGVDTKCENEYQTAYNRMVKVMNESATEKYGVWWEVLKPFNAMPINNPEIFIALDSHPFLDKN